VCFPDSRRLYTAHADYGRNDYLEYAPRLTWFQRILNLRFVDQIMVLRLNIYFQGDVNQYKKSKIAEYDEKRIRCLDKLTNKKQERN